MSEERGYCHSHMQVAGIIPKTVKKVKPPASTSLCSKTSTGDSKPGVADSNGLKTTTKPIPNGTKPPLPPSKSTPKPKSDKGKSNASTNQTSTSATTTATSINNSTNPSNQLGPNGVLSPVPIPKKKAKGKNGKKGNGEVQASVSFPVEKPPPKSKKKKVTAPVQSLCPPKWKSTETYLPTSTAFEQLKTLKILEKLTLRTGGESKGSLPSEEPPEISLAPPFLCKATSAGSTSTLDENENNSSSNPNPLETRQDFLKRVRSSFQSQYKLLRSGVKGNEKSEVRVNEALRESLLACVVIDPSRCAHILVNGEDELLEMDSKGKKLTTSATKPPNGVLNGKRKEVWTSLQGTQNSLANSTSTLLNPDKATTKPKKGKGKKVKDGDILSRDGDMPELQHSFNNVQIKLENGQVVNQLLEPWINGNLQILETLKPNEKKSKSKVRISTAGPDSIPLNYF